MQTLPRLEDGQGGMMNPTIESCRDLLGRLLSQINAHLPLMDNGYNSKAEPVPVERLPALAESVRTYVESAGMFAAIEREQLAETGSSSQDR
jgi:hypothetical protein